MASVRAPRFSLLCFGFVVCGIVTVLPGPLLPVLATHWGLRDVQSGAFFTAEFAASTVGSIVSPRRVRVSLPTGYAVMTLGVVLLVFAERAMAVATGHALALTGFALIGLGIGLSVTATNVTVGGALAESGAGGRARRLSIVNLWWVIGSMACPWMVAAAERGPAIPVFLLLVGAGSLGMFLALAPLLGMRAVVGTAARREPLAAEVRVLTFFAVFLFLYVGVETVVGGWITTYTHRFSGMTLEDASLTVSLYWMALLAGRGAGSVALRRVPERTILLTGMAVALAATMTLMQPHSTAAVLIAVAVAGFGFGPVFPVGVARMLARIADHRNTGWVFALCASGGAVLPWLTGLVSTQSGSLRLGFAVPVAALAAILALAGTENALLRGEPGARPGNTSLRG
jgi:MFS transporter, FHS family, glucose/mannose:H+ symporter